MILALGMTFARCCNRKSWRCREGMWCPDYGSRACKPGNRPSSPAASTVELDASEVTTHSLVRRVKSATILMLCVECIVVVFGFNPYSPDLGGVIEPERIHRPEAESSKPRDFEGEMALAGRSLSVVAASAFRGWCSRIRVRCVHVCCRRAWRVV